MHQLGVARRVGARRPLQTVRPFSMTKCRSARRFSTFRFLSIDQDRLALRLQQRRCSARSRRGSPAQALRSPRRESAAADWSSARGRSPASAARRPTACGRTDCARSCSRGKQLVDAAPASRGSVALQPVGGGRDEILAHGQRREDLPAFRHEADAARARSRPASRRAIARAVELTLPPLGAASGP